MRTSFLRTAFSLSYLSFAFAIPTHSSFQLERTLSPRLVSPDNSCGALSIGNYTCDSTTAGPCCSSGGWCGSTTDYCGAGCQSGYGTQCDAQPLSTYQCGPLNNNQICDTGLCCSASGFCGSTSDYCGVGCQSAYGLGNCSSTEDAATAAGLCGPLNGGASCADGKCCSVSGYCGTTQDYCSDPNNCNPLYGVCDSSSTPAGQSTLGVPRPNLGSVSYTDDIYDCTVANVVALTYDDGPSLYTSQLLDILKTYGFTATFFITGNNNGKGEIDTTAPYPALIQRMIAEGHQVASHTWSHYSLDNSTSETRISQMVKNEMALNNIIGKWPTYMRPPYSQCVTPACDADMQTLGYHRVYFDLDTQDYLNPLPSQISNSKAIVQQALADTTQNDYLSIQHDIIQQSVANLSSYYFDQIVKRGWKGVTVGECLGDDQKNWYRSFNTSSSTSMTSSTATPVPSNVPTSVGTGSSSVATSTATLSSTKLSSSSSTPSSTKVSSSSTVKPSSVQLTTSSSTKSTSSSSVKSSSVTLTTSSAAKPTSSSSVKSSSVNLTTSSSTKPTSSSKTSSTSSSKSSSYSTSSLAPKPTSSTKSSSSSTKASTTTTSAIAAATCDSKIGTFCGIISDFSTSAGCLSAVTTCNADYLKCVAANGIFGALTCVAWQSKCTTLSLYCLTCGKSCTNAKAGY